MVHGLVLAAGAGRRFGGPKALARDDDGTSWLQRAVAVLLEGGCTPVTVVLGASADEALPLLEDTGATHVLAEDWAVGMSASLRAGLAAADPDAEAALVHLVDLPDVPAEVVRRLLARPVGPTTLRRASYDGTPGHPVLLGREHWGPITAQAAGDRGARDYLAARTVETVECADLATGRDRDTGPTSGQPGPA